MNVGFTYRKKNNKYEGVSNGERGTEKVGKIFTENWLNFNFTGN